MARNTFVVVVALLDDDIYRLGGRKCWFVHLFTYQIGSRANPCVGSDQPRVGLQPEYALSQLQYIPQTRNTNYSLCLVRLPFLLDPFATWWIPITLINVFYSMSWPLHIASCVVVVFFWIELISSTDMTASGGFLTSRRWHAAVSICVVVAVEFSISAARAVVSVTAALLVISAYVNSLTPVRFSIYLLTYAFPSATYLVILLVLTVTYFYVFAQVRKFLSSLVTLGSNDKLIQRVSVRFLFTSFSFISLITMGILTATPLYDRAVGQTLIHAFINWTIDAGSTFTIAAFYGSIMTNYKSRKGSKTAPHSGSTRGHATTSPNA
jgi:hypothetical protein